MKLCKYCRWADHQEYGAWMCRHPQIMYPGERSLVTTGELEEPRPQHCELARGGRQCGRDGKLWEPKDAEPAKPTGFVWPPGTPTGRSRSRPCKVAWVEPPSASLWPLPGGRYAAATFLVIAAVLIALAVSARSLQRRS